MKGRHLGKSGVNRMGKGKRTFRVKISSTYKHIQQFQLIRNDAILSILSFWLPKWFLERIFSLEKTHWHNHTGISVKQILYHFSFPSPLTNTWHDQFMRITGLSHTLEALVHNPEVRCFYVYGRLTQHIVGAAHDRAKPLTFRLAREKRLGPN